MTISLTCVRSCQRICPIPPGVGRPLWKHFSKTLSRLFGIYLRNSSLFSWWFETQLVGIASSWLWFLWRPCAIVLLNSSGTLRNVDVNGRPWDKFFINPFKIAFVVMTPGATSPFVEFVERQPPFRPQQVEKASINQTFAWTHKRWSYRSWRHAIGKSIWRQFKRGLEHFHFIIQFFFSKRRGTIFFFFLYDIFSWKERRQRSVTIDS